MQVIDVDDVFFTDIRQGQKTRFVHLGVSNLALGRIALRAANGSQDEIDATIRSITLKRVSDVDWLDADSENLPSPLHLYQALISATPDVLETDPVTVIEIDPIKPASE